MAKRISKLLFEYIDMPGVSINPTKNDRRILIVPMFLSLQLILESFTVTLKLLILHLKFSELCSHSFPRGSNRSAQIPILVS